MAYVGKTWSTENKWKTCVRIPSRFGEKLCYNAERGAPLFRYNHARKLVQTPVFYWCLITGVLHRSSIFKNFVQMNISEPKTSISRFMYGRGFASLIVAVEDTWFCKWPAITYLVKQYFFVIKLSTPESFCCGSLKEILFLKPSHQSPQLYRRYVFTSEACCTRKITICLRIVSLALFWNSFWVCALAQGLPFTSTGV